jgi:hypothetical protein
VAMWGGGEIVAEALSFQRAVSAMMADGNAKNSWRFTNRTRFRRLPHYQANLADDALYLFCRFLCAQTVSHVALGSR